MSSRARHSRLPRLSSRTTILLLLAAVLFFSVDSIFREKGSFDFWLMRAVRDFENPFIEWNFRTTSRLTDSRYAIAFWGVLLVAFTWKKRWLDSLAVAVIPVAGLISFLIQGIVRQERPDPAVFEPGIFRDSSRNFSMNDYESFPSGHVAGGMLLWGYIFVLAGRIPNRPLRLSVRAFALWIVVLVGPSRMWLGVHWGTDVLVGYALGGLWLAVILTCYRAMAPSTAGVPLIRSGVVTHPEALPHAHALTSTLLFRDGRVYKIYNPGFVPRLIYWMAFQAPFGYAHNRLAAEAAVHRRNLAAKLTEAWFGTPRVSPALGVAEVSGRLAIVGHYTEGKEPADHQKARDFLFDIARRFDEVGLPTWQIDPRQPRSLGNILETPSGEYVIIDLESGLVSPLASPRAWWRAIRRGLVPMYDDIFFDLTRAYVTKEESRLRKERGDAWFEELAELLANAEGMIAAWHESEPRWWSRTVLFFEHGFGIPDTRAAIRRRTNAGREKADTWIEGAIDTWRREDRLTDDEADNLRASLLAPGTQAVLPHFGVHLVIGIALRFPFGAITRAAYTTINLLYALIRFLVHRTTWAKFRLDFSIHSPIVILLAMVPGFGTFAYLASGPIWRNHLLARVALDAVAEKVPFKLYRRFGVKRIIARPIRTGSIVSAGPR